MSGANWVAVVSVIFTSLTAGYATYENNQTNKDLEKLKQEQSFSVEKLKQEQSLKLEEMKSAQAKELTLQNRTFEVRTQFCNEAKALYKDLASAVIASKNRNLETRALAMSVKDNLTIQTYAYLDDAIYDRYMEQAKGSSQPNDSAIVAALSTQVRRCATMKPSDF